MVLPTNDDMPQRQYLTLSKRIVDRLAVDGKDAVFWDRELPGFGVSVYPSGRKVYVIQTRANGTSKRVTVGHHGEIAPAPDPTVSDLAGCYMREHVAAHCKPGTVNTYWLMLRNHIVPRLG